MRSPGLEQREWDADSSWDFRGQSIDLALTFILLQATQRKSDLLHRLGPLVLPEVNEAHITLEGIDHES